MSLILLVSQSSPTFRVPRMYSATKRIWFLWHLAKWFSNSDLVPPILLIWELLLLHCLFLSEFEYFFLILRMIEEPEKRLKAPLNICDKFCSIEDQYPPVDCDSHVAPNLYLMLESKKGLDPWLIFRLKVLINLSTNLAPFWPPLKLVAVLRNAGFITNRSCKTFALDDSVAWLELQLASLKLMSPINWDNSMTDIVSLFLTRLQSFFIFCTFSSGSFEKQFCGVYFESEKKYFERVLRWNNPLLLFFTGELKIVLYWFLSSALEYDSNENT